MSIFQGHKTNLSLSPFPTCQISSSCFKGRILKQNKDKCFIFLCPHSWKQPASLAEIFPQSLTGGHNPPWKKKNKKIKKLPPSLRMVWQSCQQPKAGSDTSKHQESLKPGGISSSPLQAHGVRLQHTHGAVTLFIGCRVCASSFQGLFPLFFFFFGLRKPGR